MKKFTRRNSFATKFAIFLVMILAFIIVHSCRKDSREPRQSQSAAALVNNNINLSALKAAYNKGIKTNSLKVADLSQPVANLIASLNVDWTSYVLTTYPDSTQVIEFAIPNDTALVVPGTLAPHDTIKYHAKTSAVFILRQDTINMSFFMKTVEDCTAPGYQSVISNVFYNNEPSTFNGNVYYFTLARQYINGYQWLNGAVLKALSIGASTQQQQSQTVKASRQKSQNRKINKSIVDEVELTNCVTDVYGVYNVTVDQQGNILSWQNQVGTIYVTTCDVVNTTSGTSGGTTTVSSSGGGGGVAGAPSLPQPCPGGSGATVAAVKGKLVIDVTQGASGGTTTTSPCAVVVTTKSTPIFGINNSNAEVPDANFDALLSYAESLGLTVSDPFNVTLTVNGVNYSGQITEIYNSNGEIVAAYFSPDATSGPFATGMEYSIGNGNDGTTSTDSSGGISYGNLGFGNPTPVIVNSVPTYTHSGGAGGTITSITNQELAAAAYVSDGRAGINPQLYINCFTDGKTASGYKMTIYVNQPVPGTNSQWTTGVRITTPTPTGELYMIAGGQLLMVGHTFVCFEKDNTDGTSVKQVMGFYPGGNGIDSKGIIKDDSGHPYNVSYSASVTAVEFQMALTRLLQDNSNANYVLTNGQSPSAEYNCTDAGITWMLTASVHLPASVARGAFDNTPGDYGQVLANFSGASKTSGTAPQGHGPCNAN